MATYWLGNTARIAERHYLQIPEDVYQPAAQNPAQSEAAVQNPVQHAAACGGISQSVAPQGTPENGVMRDDSDACKSLQSKGMETKGIEPSFRHCERRVLPLHHVPGINSRYCIGCRSDVKRCLTAFGKIS